jgi:hypothetical protein
VLSGAVAKGWLDTVLFMLICCLTSIVIILFIKQFSWACVANKAPFGKNIAPLFEKLIFSSHRGCFREASISQYKRAFASNKRPSIVLYPSIEL